MGRSPSRSLASADDAAAAVTDLRRRAAAIRAAVRRLTETLPHIDAESGELLALIARCARHDEATADVLMDALGVLRHEASAAYQRGIGR